MRFSHGEHIAPGMVQALLCKGKSRVKLSERSKQILGNRRFHRDMTARGYEEVGERGGRLWEIYRGGRVGSRIIDAVVAPNGMSVYVRIAATND